MFCERKKYIYSLLHCDLHSGQQQNVYQELVPRNQLYRGFLASGDTRKHKAMHFKKIGNKDTKSQANHNTGSHDSWLSLVS